MRRTMRRRSTSSWVSPGPRVPMRAPPAADMPPACCDSAPPGAAAGQPVAELGQLDLGLALLAVGVLGEDVEDHRGAVDRGAAQQLLEVELLGGGELVVEHDRVAVGGQRQLAQLLGLALAHVGGRVGRLAPLVDAADLVGAGGVDQQGQLVDRVLGLLDRLGWDGDADQHDLLAEGPFDQRHGDAPSSISATYAAGPRSTTSSRSGGAEGHLGPAARHVDRHPVAGQAPPPGGDRRGAGARCRTPAWGRRRARRCGRRCPRRRCGEQVLAPPATLPLTASPSHQVDLVVAGSSRDRRRRPGTGRAPGGVAHVDQQRRGHAAAGPLGRLTLDPGGAHRHRQLVGHAVDPVVHGDRAQPGVGGDRDLGRGRARAGEQQRLGQAADAVAAHLGARPVGVAQLHAGVRLGGPREWPG